jgi:chromosomal replication initiator protein
MGEETIYNIWSSLDLATQAAILQQEADQQNVILPEDAARYIAQGFHSNGTALRNAFARLLAHSPMYGRRLTLDSTKRILGKSIDVQGPKSTVDPLEKTLFVLHDAQQATSPRRHPVIVDSSVIFRLMKTRETRNISRVRRQFEVNMRELEREGLARLDVYERALEILAKKRKRA